MSLILIALKLQTTGANERMGEDLDADAVYCFSGVFLLKELETIRRHSGHPSRC